MKTTLIKLQLAAAVVSTLVHLPSAFGQGSLTPPGAPAPTMKTLDQIDAKLEKRTPITFLPYFISSPGSYYVVTNLTGIGGPADGVTIQADDVTLDLNGFLLDGAGGGGSGVHVSPGHTNVCVRNGTLGRWAGSGVDAGTTVNSRLENLRAVGNGGSGLAAGSGGTVKDSSAQGNSSSGITAGDGCLVKDSVAYTNNQLGITVGDACSVLHCNASYNGSNGITTGNGTTISQCTAARNGAMGINLVGVGCVVSDCAVYWSHGVGINGINGCLIRDCSVYFGDTDGIVVNFECQVLNNNSSANGFGSASGIRCTSRRNRIEGNYVADNLNKGIDCGTTTPNVIIKNSASGNAGGNYVNTAGNDVGPIGSAAISTSPWANISF